MAKKPNPSAKLASLMKKDDAMDKKMGVKENSKKDLAMDKKMGINDNVKGKKPTLVVAIGVGKAPKSSGKGKK